MSKPKILIIGCGAVGLAQGFHLSFGADITYLVRPGRTPAFKPPKTLYDYKTNRSHTFDSYRLVESTKELASEKFFCVFDTLDGATARTESGNATLRAVGELIRSHAETFVVYDAIGLDMKKYYATTLGISEDRILLGLSMLAHQPSDNITVPPTASRELIAKANMLYIANGGNGLMISESNPSFSAAFRKVYLENGMVGIGNLPPVNEELLVSLSIPMLVGWHTHGWGPFQGFVDDTDMWQLTVKASKEVLAFPRYGWTGYLLSFIMGSWIQAKMNLTIEKSSLPLQYHEFNKFHHGAKVHQQDIDFLVELVEEGEKSKASVTALKELVRRAKERNARSS